MNLLYWEDYQEILEEIISFNKGLSKSNSSSISIVYNPFNSINLTFQLYDVPSYPKYYCIDNIKNEKEALLKTKDLILDIVDKIAQKKDYTEKVISFLKENKREHLIE